MQLTSRQSDSALPANAHDVQESRFAGSRPISIRGRSHARGTRLWDAFYTNRRRLADLRASVKPGGVVLVETHLRSASRIRQGGHRRYGVRRGELRQWFRDWEILALEEGRFADHGTVHALSRIVARRPC